MEFRIVFQIPQERRFAFDDENGVSRDEHGKETKLSNLGNNKM